MTNAQQYRELTFGDYVTIAKRRALWIAVPAVLVTILAVGASFVVPPSYVSRSMVLIEQPKVPGEYVRPIVTQDLNGRLTTMAETIFSRTRLQPIIERFGLYSSGGNIDEKIEKLRKDIVVKPVRSELERGDGAPGFFIAVTARHPRIAQQICAEITSMFLAENLKSREQSAEGTTQFLHSQLDEAKRVMDEQDANLAAFQKQYLGQLPGQEQANLNMLQALSTQLAAATHALDRAQQERTYTATMLAEQTAAAETATGDTAAPEQLESKAGRLQRQLEDLEARYTPDHPDVLKVRRELKQLRQQDVEATSSAASGKPKPSSSSDAANPKRSSPSEKPAVDTAAKTPTVQTPQLRELRARLQQLDTEVAADTAEQNRIQQEIKTYEERLQLSPMVQEKYRQLTRDSETAQRFYNDLLAKNDQSAMSTDLERRQEGEQFHLMDPPNLPVRPAFPNRLLFAMGGLAGGLCVGGGLAAWAEYRDQTLRTERDVLYFTKLETLGMVPAIASAAPRKSKPPRPQKKELELPTAARGERT